MIDRAMRWWFQSIWTDLVVGLALWWSFVAQHGWQRWILFTGSLLLVMSFFRNGQKRWGKPKQATTFTHKTTHGTINVTFPPGLTPEQKAAWLKELTDRLKTR